MADRLDQRMDASLAADAAPTGNEYVDVLMDEYVRGQSTRMAGALTQADARKADEIGRQRRVASYLGYPTAAVEALPEQTTKEMQVRQAQQHAAASPDLARAYTDADFARLAVDDGGPLSTLANSLRRGWPGLRSNLSATSLRANANAAAQLDATEKLLADGRSPASLTLAEDPHGIAWLTPAERAAYRDHVLSAAAGNATNIAEQQAKRAAIPAPDVVNQVMQARTFGEAIKAFRADPVTFVLAIGPESLVQSAPGLVGAAVVPGGAGARAAVMGAGSAATDYGSSLIEALQREGVDTSNPAALRSAAADEKLMRRAAAQAMAHAAVVGTFDALSGGVADKVALPKAVAARLATRPAAREVANTIAQVPVQGTLGGLGEAGGELAAGQPLDPGNILAEVVGEGFTAPAEIAGVAARTVRERVQRATEAQATAQALEHLNKVATDSKLRERAPDLFEKFIADASAASPLQEVYVSAEALMQSDVDLQALLDAVPAVREQLAEARATGGDVVIPIEQFAAYVAGTDAAGQLIPHLRTSPDGMTAAEAGAFNQDEALQAEVRQLLDQHEGLVDAPAQGPTPVEQARQAILDQLTAVNRFTPDVNAAYADLMAAFVATTAERAGMPVQDFMAQFAPVITAQVSSDQRPALESTVPAGEAPPPDAQPAQQPAQQPATPSSTAAEGGQPSALGQGEAPHRGSYAPSTRTIALLERADLSTFVHESAHYYLDVLTQLAARSDAPGQVRDDVQSLMTWFGVPDLAAWQAMSLDEQRDAHEKFARGFEAYAFEGQAPSLELAGVFHRFRAWLLRIYRSLVALNVQLTPEVRAAMSRMLASDAQIEAAEAARSYRPLFSSAEQAGMTEDEWQAYQKLGTQATADAVDQLQARSLRDMQWMANAKAREVRKLQRDALAKRKAIEAEVRAEVEALPLYRAETLLRTGKLDGEHVGVKLSRPALMAMYGEEEENARWRQLPEAWLTNNPETGVHPDVLADGLGLSSGDQLVTQLTTFDRAETVIEGQTDQRMLERYGDLTDERAIERAAEEAIHNQVRAKALEREVNALAKAVGSRPVLAKAARQYAEQSIAAKRVRSVRPAQYTAAEARAGREAAAAFKTGDTARAAILKRNQLLNHELARAAGRAVTEAAKAVDYLRTFDSKATREAIGQDYVDQIEALLERFDLRASVTGKQLERRKSLAGWVEDQRELGFEPAIDDRLLADAGKTHIRDLTMEQLRGLRDTIRNIEHLGRLKQKLLTVQDQRAFDAIVAEVSQSIRDHATKTIEQQIENDLPRDRAGKLLTQFMRRPSESRQPGAADGWRPGRRAPVVGLRVGDEPRGRPGGQHAGRCHVPPLGDLRAAEPSR